MRVRHKPWAADEVRANPEVVIADPAAYKGKWHSDIFKNNNPIHLELGTGKGQFVCGMAKLHPDINYIGVELQTSVIALALKKVQEADVTNLKLLNQNVVDLHKFFEAGECERIYLNFSDPWPKKKHEKRRLTYRSFLDIYRQLIGAGQEIHFKTDNRVLFEFSLASFSQYGCILKNISLDLHQSDMEGNVMTEYEEKFSAKGQPIYRSEAILPEMPRAEKQVVDA